MAPSAEMDPARLTILRSAAVRGDAAAIRGAVRSCQLLYTCNLLPLHRCEWQNSLNYVPNAAFTVAVRLVSSESGELGNGFAELPDCGSDFRGRGASKTQNETMPCRRAEVTWRQWPDPHLFVGAPPGDLLIV